MTEKRNVSAQEVGIPLPASWHGPVMKTIKAVTAALSTVVLLCAPVAPASAERYWNKKVKCEETDADGRVIPTRYGNGDLGWNHFSGKHNIKNCRVVDAALSGKVDAKDGGRLEYLGVALKDGKQVTIEVIVQYTRRTADGEYDAGKGNKIGVITAYCKGMNKCPDWING
jgi:hypothetical protein